MTFFNKPAWLRPEVNEPMYWLHLVIIVFLLNTLTSVNLPYLTGIGFLALADIIAHSVLGLD